VELQPFRIERWYERFEFTTELMLSSSDCESVSIAELLAALALRHRKGLVERNRRLVLDNLALADAFIERHAELIDWVRPSASPIGFPRLHVSDTHAFCEALAAEAGVLLLPGEVYDEPGHVRLRLGRVGVPEALARLEGYVGATTPS